MSPEEKLAAKRFNEHVKLATGLLNNAALTLASAALIIPAVSNGSVLLTSRPWLLLLLAFGLHFVGQAFLRLLRSEE